MGDANHRGTPRDAAPFCWQSKAAREAIRSGLDGTDHICAALSIYDALCEIESDVADALDAAGAFETTHAHIAMKAGLSPATVKRRMNDLEELRLVAATAHPGPKGPKKYRLLARPAQRSIAHNEPSIAHGPASAPRPRSEERETERTEAVHGAGAAPRSHACETLQKQLEVRRPLPKTPGEILDFADSVGISREVATAFVYYQHANRWMMKDRKTGEFRHLFDWQKALQRFAQSDAERQRTLKVRSISNEEFWRAVTEQGCTREMVNAWIAIARRAGWKILNRMNGRREAIRDPVAACVKFCQSPLPVELDERDELDPELRSQRRKTA